MEGHVNCVCVNAGIVHTCQMVAGFVLLCSTVVGRIDNGHVVEFAGCVAICHGIAGQIDTCRAAAGDVSACQAAIYHVDTCHVGLCVRYKIP